MATDKRCPFCGGEGSRIYLSPNGKSKAVGCGRDGCCQGPWVPNVGDDETANYAWNCRVPAVPQGTLRAAAAPDWRQVVLNGGPPCFHVEDGRFCFRTAAWHDPTPNGRWTSPHPYVSLSTLLRADS